MNESEFSVPAGVYLLGDPELLLKPAAWSEFLKSNEEYLDQKNAFCLAGKTVFAMKTFYGPGTFHDHDGYTYLVNSGIIALLPIADFLKEGTPFFRAVLFRTDTICSSFMGELVFGDIRIETKTF